MYDQKLRVLLYSSGVAQLDTWLDELLPGDRRNAIRVESIERFEQIDLLRDELRRFSTDIALVHLHFRYLPYFAQRGQFAAVDDLIGKHRGRYLEAALELGRWQQRLYGLPEDCSPYLLVSRRDLLDRHALSPPNTLDELLAQAQNGAGLAVETSVVAELHHGLPLLALVLGAAGLDLASAPSELIAQREAIGRAYRSLQRLQAITGFVSDPPRNQAALNQLRDGEVCHALCWSGATAQLPAEIAAELVFTPLLAHPAARLPMQGNGWCIPANTRDRGSAAMLLDAVTRPAFIQRCESDGGWSFPAQPALWNDPAILADKPFYADADTIFQQTERCTAIVVDNDRSLLWRSLVESLLAGDELDVWIERIQHSSDEIARSNVKQAVVQRALDYIERHLAEIEQLTDIAAHVRLHSDHLGVLFKRELGLSCWAYVTERRMSRALDLLRDVTLDIKEVAERVGIKPSYFNQSFRRRFGCPPTEMRRSLLRNG